MQISQVTSYNPNFTGKEQRYFQIGKTLVPIHKVSADPSPEPPKTFLGKVGNGIKYILDKLYYYCFCAK